MQIDDILKAAIQDAGLEFFNTSGTYSSPSSNSSESSLANLGGLDDDFNLTDLDWNLLDQSEADSPPASISSCSISQSPPLITTTTTNQIHTHNNPTFGDNIDQEDTDPFILALQELDDKNNLYKDCHQDTSFYDNTSNISNISNKIVDANLRPQVLPAPPKIVSLTSQNSFSQQTSTGTTGNGKSSDLLSLINYRASTVVNNQKANSQVFEIFKFNRGWKTKLWCIKHKQPENQQTNLKISNNSCNVKQKPSPVTPNTNIKLATTTVSYKPPVIACPTRPAFINRQISLPNPTSTNLTNNAQRTPTSSLINPIKVINLSQIQQKNLQDKLNTNKLSHKIIQIANNAQNSILSTLQSATVQQNTTDPPSAAQQSTNTVKITKVVSSRPASFSNPHNKQNIVYLNKNSLMNDVKSRTNLNPSVFLAANETQSLINQHPPKMRLLGNVSSKTHHQFITKTTSSPVNKIPRFYTTPTKIISTQYLNNTTNNTSGTSNHHINILNSNINRYLNQSKQIGNINSNSINSTPIQSNTNISNSSSSLNSSNTVTFSPRYLMNINNNNNNIPNNLKICNNISNLNDSSSNQIGGCSSLNTGAIGTPSSLNNYFLQEQDEDVVVDEEEELGHAETYANYMPSKLQIGKRHPDPIVETSSLASVEPPEVWYELAMPETIYRNGALSALQLEAIVYSCQKHADFLPNNHRCGFLIGDGAGVGKGRTIAGIIYENYLLGRKKALWLSVSNDLKYDAERDFADIGAGRVQVHSLNKLKYSKISSKQNAKIKKGVIFSTYSSLIGESQHKSTKKKYSSRLKQLLQWLGGDSFDGLIVFDECHKAKNLVPNGSAKPTKTGLAVLELQEKLPNARIVYASATGASEPKNMAYMVRLGLWGTGTPFTDFNDFIQSIEKRGVGAMEIVAMDMKLRGMYMARQLSFSGVTFKIEEIPLQKEYVRMYNDAVQLWVDMKEKFQEAIELIDSEGKLKKTVWGQFWSSHQRFFKYLCMACKVPRVVELAQTALKENKCVVIGLQSTGEARTVEQLDEYGEVNEFISTARGVLQNLVEKHFPSVESLMNSSNVLNAEMKQIIEAKKLAKAKADSKNSQKVNDILQRLSSYTNTNYTHTATNLKDNYRNKNKGPKNNTKSNNKFPKKLRSSSMSSFSSQVSSFSSSSENLKSDYSENHSPNFSDFESSLDEDNCDGEDDEDNEEESDVDGGAEEDPFKIHEKCNHDLETSFDFEESNINTCKNNKKKSTLDSDSGLFSLDSPRKEQKISSVKFDSLFDLILSDEAGVNQNTNNIDSDDSDSLFSITKSVSVNTLQSFNSSSGVKSQHATGQSSRQNHNNYLKRINTGRKTSKKRMRLSNKSMTGLLYENEEDDDDEIDEPEESEVSSNVEKDHISEDDLKLPTKRASCCLSEQQSNESEELSVSSFNRPAARTRPTRAYEILDYICQMKRDLLNAIRQLGKRLPANTLDELIDLFDGPANVAEMTGRKGRIVHKQQLQTNTNSFVYETRNEFDVPIELLNVAQKEKFMNGQKLIAIISEAASSGISLQANRRNANQFRRVHITIELPWSADRAIQQFGRTHRSNQVSAPEYVFLISELAGEKRFASTVAKRLESLGALTHGDRRATESRDLSRFNIDNKYGRAALENVIKSICNLEKPMAKLPKKYKGNFMPDARRALNGVGMIVCSKNTQTAYPDKDYNSINKFLNRLLGVPVDLQNAIFQFFSDVLAAVILEAKRTGKWDMGILDLGSNNEIVFRRDTKFYVLDARIESQRRVEMHTVLVERGLSWEKALEMYRKTDPDEKLIELPQGFYLSNQIKNSHRIAVLALPFVPPLSANEVEKSDEGIFLAIYRPNTGLQVRQETRESLLKKYKKVSPAEAKFHWNEQYFKSAQQCTHVYRQAHCVNMRNCEVGLRTRRFHILAGSVLTVWTRVENLLSTLTGSSQFRLQIIRVKTDDDQKIVGCVIPTRCLRQTDALLNSISDDTYLKNHVKEEKEDIIKNDVVEFKKTFENIDYDYT